MNLYFENIAPDLSVIHQIYIVLWANCLISISLLNHSFSEAQSISLQVHTSEGSDKLSRLTGSLKACTLTLPTIEGFRPVLYNSDSFISSKRIQQLSVPFSNQNKATWMRQGQDKKRGPKLFATTLMKESVSFVDNTHPQNMITFSATSRDFWWRWTYSHVDIMSSFSRIFFGWSLLVVFGLHFKQIICCHCFRPFATCQRFERNVMV